MTSDEDAGQGQRAGEASLASGARPVNPYIAGAPVSGPEMFYGRDDVFAFIRRTLIGQHRDTPIVLKGERRTGKTSVLYQVRRHLDPAYRCVSIDMHGLSLNGLSDLLNGIASSVSDGLRSDYGLDITSPGRAAFEADPRSAFESGFLPAVLAALGEDHLVLMLDEVVRLDEQVRAGRLDREVFSYLRYLMQHYPRLNFIFSLGSGLEEMQKDYAFLFSGAMYHRISFLEETAARKLITDPARGYFEVSPDAIDTILRLTSRHPYYTQLVCHSLFDRWSSGASRPAMTAEDVYAVLGEAIELGSSNLTYVWEDSSAEEKAVMAGMAAAMQADQRAVAGRAVTGKAIRDAWRKAGVPLPERKLSAALRSLASREVITGTAPYSFTVDLQRLWLDKHRRLDWLKDELAESIQQWIHDSRTSRARYLAAAAALIVIAGGLTAWRVLSTSSSSAPPQIGYISASVGPEKEFIDVPNPDNSQNLGMSKCLNPTPLYFDCYKLDIAASDTGKNSYKNQQWLINSARLANGEYVATIESNFSGNWKNISGQSLGPAFVEYLSLLNLTSSSVDVGLVPVEEKLEAGNPTGHQYQYWILRAEPGGTWQIASFEAPQECISSSAHPELEVEACQSSDTDQLWTINV